MLLHAKPASSARDVSRLPIGRLERWTVWTARLPSCSDRSCPLACLVGYHVRLELLGEADTGGAGPRAGRSRGLPARPVYLLSPPFVLALPPSNDVQHPQGADVRGEAGSVAQG
jgi:hypothetical protein